MNRTAPTPDAADAPAWSPAELQQPHAEPDKAQRVQRMFTAIARSYDLNNRLHSFGRDQAWRTAAVRMAQLQPTDRVVDVACGTGDLTLAFARRLAELSDRPQPVLGLDFTPSMLDIARVKADRVRGGIRGGVRGGAAGDVQFEHGDATALDLPDSCCDVVSIAFGIRNVDRPEAALAEFYRVVRPGGRLIVLEFTVPRRRLMRWGYDLYCGVIMPRTAALIAGDRSGAYRYLPRSVNTFGSREKMTALIESTGFSEVQSRPLTMGIATCYRGTKQG